MHAIGADLLTKICDAEVTALCLDSAVWSVMIAAQESMFGALVFDCPHFQGFRQQHAEIFQDSHDAMRSLMWHNDQKSVCALVLAIVNEAQTA